MPDDTLHRSEAEALTHAAVEKLYAGSRSSGEAHKLVIWHLPIAEALVAEWAARGRATALCAEEAWRITEKAVCRFYAMDGRFLETDTVRVTTALHVRFVQACVELLCQQPVESAGRA